VSVEQGIPLERGVRIFGVEDVVAVGEVRARPVGIVAHHVKENPLLLAFDK
jgi:hypothetical protein